MAGRDCTDCQLFVYDEKTGERAMHNGQPVKRIPQAPAPCRIRPDGCPKGTPENSKAFTERNWQAFEHYRECQATGRFPADPIVERNAGILHGVEQQIARHRQERIELLLQAMIAR